MNLMDAPLSAVAQILDKRELKGEESGNEEEGWHGSRDGACERGES